MTEIVDVLAFFVSTGIIQAVVLGLLFALVLTAVVVRQDWLDAPVWLTFVAVFSVVDILVFTLFREVAILVPAVASGVRLTMPGWTGPSTGSPDDLWRALADPLGSTQMLLNTLLFLPAGLLWTVVTRRPWTVLGALGALSVAIELVQAVTGLGAYDVADIVANVAGTATGVGVAVLAGWVTEGIGGRVVSRRRWWCRGVTVAVAAVCALLLPVVGAAQRQAALMDEASRHFEGTTLTDVERWERQGELDRVCGAVCPPATRTVS
ncbi:hypothetical protein GA707_07360 [Nostocoides sp. F2B08]|uniref:VanZ family protein n=1 Tax=Nostocoides sp. F2B08 TaxID=2653936 RepID=UPI0012635B12|nr:VanZ family protein [Tetrasphaera sp. F2B08]KAB7745711.1 hypothetical protein GA707_07360 [Tetrasphaera sp. F2B08]